MTKRKVNHRSKSTSTTKLRQPRISSSKARRFLEIQKQRKVTAFKLIVAAMACYLAARVIKYFLYSVFFTEGQEPGGLTMIIVLYIQTALLIATFGFILFSLIKMILFLFKYEGQ